MVHEYNGSMPGALNYSLIYYLILESFEDRPVCYIGIASGQFAGLRPVEHLQQVFDIEMRLIFQEKFSSQLFMK